MGVEPGSVLVGKREVKKYNNHKMVVIVPGARISEKEGAKKIKEMLGSFITEKEAKKMLEEKHSF